MTEAAEALEVEGWWHRWPDANVAVATGSVSGLVVIDVDPRNGGEETLFRLQLEHDILPMTLESETGGGGRHLWYGQPELPVASGMLGPGVELKGQRGLIVAPPSRHLSGDRYRWLDYTEPTAPLPSWVPALVAGPPGSSSHDLAPLRTEAERNEFRETWAQTGVELSEGDAYYLCPFHDDHHPSLHIDAEGCRWYCFACRIGGGTGRLLQELGMGRRPAPRARMTGWIGPRAPVTITGESEVDVVGESFHQDELLAISGGRRRFGGVDLRAAAELDHIEGNGVEVRIDDRPIGFLSHEDSRRYLGLVDQTARRLGAARSLARIRGGWDRGRGDVGLFGVTLLMPDQPGPEEEADRSTRRT